MMWVTATAWLHDAAGQDGSKALAMTTAVVGIGSLVGPAFAGFVGERYSIGTPFVLLGIACAVTGVTLVFAPGEEGRVPEPGPPLADMVRAARADDLMVTSVMLTLVVALMWMTTELLVPLRLDELGYSATAIGLAFSASAVVFAATSAFTARGADRYATIRVAGDLVHGVRHRAHDRGDLRVRARDGRVPAGHGCHDRRDDRAHLPARRGRRGARAGSRSPWSARCSTWCGRARGSSGRASAARSRRASATAPRSACSRCSDSVARGGCGATAPGVPG